MRQDVANLVAHGHGRRDHVIALSVGELDTEALELAVDALDDTLLAALALDLVEMLPQHADGPLVEVLGLGILGKIGQLHRGQRTARSALDRADVSAGLDELRHEAAQLGELALLLLEIAEQGVGTRADQLGLLDPSRGLRNRLRLEGELDVLGRRLCGRVVPHLVIDHESTARDEHVDKEDG